jgi:hypothetical protein
MRPGFEISLLEVEPHAVPERDELDVEIGDVFPLLDLAGRAEIRVGPTRCWSASGGDTATACACS